MIAADRKTIHLVLTAPDLIKYGTFVSNQYTNVFAGGFAYLKLYPDPELKDLLLKRFADDIHEHQSPAGYFYEEDGPTSNTTSLPTKATSRWPGITCVDPTRANDRRPGTQMV